MPNIVSAFRQSAAAAAAPAGPELDEVFGRLYREQAVTMVRLANLLVRDRAAAEDVVQDVFLRVYQALPRLTDHGRLLPYLRTAVVNGSRSVLHGRGTYVTPGSGSAR